MATFNPDDYPQVHIGSRAWVSDERDKISQLVDERLEDFYFRYAEKPLEWLNARMDDIFTGDQMDVADVFKTPGKLRGKASGATRTRNRPDDRAPLADIFTSGNQIVPSPSNNIPFYSRIAQIQVAEDREHRITKSTLTSRVLDIEEKENRDSNHQNVLRSEKPVSLNPDDTNPKVLASHHDSRTLAPFVAKNFPNESASVDQARVTEESFITAAEEQGDEKLRSQTPKDEAVTIESSERIESHRINDFSPKIVPNELAKCISDRENISANAVTSIGPIPAKIEENLDHLRQEPDIMVEDLSPQIPLIRKSSLSFACLPARQPLVAKMGAESRASRTSNLDLAKSMCAANQIRSATSDFQIEQTDVKANLTSFEPMQDNSKSENKTSTQRLQERLAMLGKSSHTQQSKSVNLNTMPHHLIASEAAPTPSTKNSLPGSFSNEDDVDDPWIEPISKAENFYSLPKLLQRAASSEDVFENESAMTNDGMQMPNASIESVLCTEFEENKPEDVDLDLKDATFQPSLAAFGATDSTTPAGSPILKRNIDGPLSASKARFYSVLQSAKGIFASSAGVSAQAKIDILPPPTNRQNFDASTTSPSRFVTQGVELFKSADNALIQDTWRKSKAINAPLTTATNAENGCKEQKPGSSTVCHNTSKGKLGSHSKDENVAGDSIDIPPPPPPKDTQRSGLAQKPNEARRPTKLAKEVPQKLKPAPVSIRVASQRIGQALPSNSTLAASLQTTLAGPAPARSGNITKKNSNSSLHHSSSVQSLKGSTSAFSTRPKALEVAARKKEMDEREAQRKTEQKRDLERKRTAKQEEDRKQAQEQKAAEQQRILDAKAAAQRQATEHRKADAIRKKEDHRGQVTLMRTASIKEPNAPHHDRPQQQSKGSKGEPAVARPLSRPQPSQECSRPPIPHVNPAKPPKRTHQQDEEENWTLAPSTQAPAKRRRTSDECITDPPGRPTMAPPIRLSAMRKEANNKQSQNYMNNASYMSQSVHRSAMLAQHQAQHPKTPHTNDFAKSANSRIVFAEAPNPPQNAVVQPGNHSSKLQAPKSVIAIQAKSSPHYPNGDSIELPDIATDSEDSDDENGDFIPPEWADSPALRDLLRRQQLVDPMKVFGPIAPLMMEEVFKGSKDRHARFRARTSSANWNGPDRLTEEERKKDREARELLEREGGWTFQGSNT